MLREADVLALAVTITDLSTWLSAHGGRHYVLAREERGEDER